MFLASLLHFALAASSVSASIDPPPLPAQVRVVAVLRVPPLYGGVPVYLQGVTSTSSAPFVIATDEDPAILAPPESKTRRFGFESEGEVAARARQLIAQYALAEGEADSPALRNVLARHGGAAASLAVARVDSR